MKFLVTNYSCLQNPRLGLPSPDPRSLCLLSSTKFLEPHPPNKIPEYATGHKVFYVHILNQVFLKPSILHP